MGLCTPYKETKGYYLKKENEKKTDVKKNFANVGEKSELIYYLNSSGGKFTKWTWLGNKERYIFVS